MRYCFLSWLVVAYAHHAISLASPRFTLGVFARIERDLRAVDLTLDGTSTDAWTPTSVYAGVEVLVL